MTYLAQLLLLVTLALLFVSGKRRGGWWYGFAYATSLYAAVVVVVSLLSQILLGKLDTVAIAIGVTLVAGVIYRLDQRSKLKDHPFVHSSLVTATTVVLVGIFVYASVFNIVKFMPYSGALPLVGTNDDNANHVAMAAAAIRDKSLLTSSPSIDRLIQNAFAVGGTQWYPPTLYTAISHIYRTIYSDKLQLDGLINVTAVYLILQVVILVILMYSLVDRLYKARSLSSLALMIAFGLFVVMGEFFLKLYLYGFYAQLLAYNLMLLALCELAAPLQTRILTPVTALCVSLLLFGINMSSYWYIPLGGIIYFYAHARLEKRKWYTYIPYAAWTAGCCFIVAMNFSRPVLVQNTALGVAFVGFTGVMMAMIGPLVSVLMKNTIHAHLRALLLILIFITILSMIFTAAGIFADSNNLGYYFFKSYWTIGLFGLPLLIATTAILMDRLVARHSMMRYGVGAVSTILAAAMFYFVFSQNQLSSRGYDSILAIHNGMINYFAPRAQRQWIDLQKKFDDKNGKAIYVFGKWGESTLGHVLFGEAPDMIKRNEQTKGPFLNQQLLISYAEEILRRLSIGERIYVIDGTGVVATVMRYRAGGDLMKSRVKESLGPQYVERD